MTCCQSHLSTVGCHMTGYPYAPGCLWDEEKVVKQTYLPVNSGALAYLKITKNNNQCYQVPFCCFVKVPYVLAGL